MNRQSLGDHGIRISLNWPQFLGHSFPSAFAHLLACPPSWKLASNALTRLILSLTYTQRDEEHNHRE